MQATQLCQRCGYDLPGGADACPECRDHIQPVSRAARQVAGMDLPTRSVHELHAVPPVRERRIARSGRRPTWTADLIAFSLLLTLLTATARLIAIFAHTDRFSVQVAPVTLDRIDLIVVALAWATAAAVVLTALAMVAQVLRFLGRQRHRPVPDTALVV